MPYSNNDKVTVRLKSLNEYDMDRITTHGLVIGNIYPARYVKEAGDDDCVAIDIWYIHLNDVEILAD